MSVRRKDTASEQGEIKIGSSWIPETSAKATSPNRGENQTRRERLASTNQAAQASLSGSEEFVQQTQCQREPACYASMSVNNASRVAIANDWHACTATNSRAYKENLIGFESWVAGEAADSHMFGKGSMNDPDQWSNVSFRSLFNVLGMKVETGNDALTQSNFATSSSASSCCFHPQFDHSLIEDPLGRSGVSNPNFRPQVEGRQFTMSSGSTSLQDQHTMLGANFDAQGRMPNTVTDRSSLPSGHLLNLNSPPRMITDAALRKSTPCQCEPKTPEKTNRGGQQEPAMKHSTIDEAHTREKNDIMSDGVMRLLEKEKSPLVNDQLSEVMSTELQENHKPDKGGMDEADLLKTPQQKTRRKKHRPKVIIEGKNKRTPKSSAQKTSVPQDTTRVKRKYVRKNGVNSLLGGGFGTNGAEPDNKTPSSNETSLRKRKHRRRKGISNSEDDTDKETTKTTEIQGGQRTRRSCRRSLNFNSDDPVRDGNSPDSSSNCERELQASNISPKDRPETEQHPQSPLLNTLKENHMPTDQRVYSIGKCQIVFSDVTRDKEANTVQVGMNFDGQLSPKSPSDSINSSTCLKRHNMDKTVEAALGNRNESGISYNSLQAYFSTLTQNADAGIPGLHFPAIYKKKRTEKVYSTVTSSMQIAEYSDNGGKLERQTLRDSCNKTFMSSSNQGSYGGQSQVINLQTTKYATDGRQVYEDLLALEPTQRIKRRRSKAPTCQRNVASPMENCKQWLNFSSKAAKVSRTPQNIESLNEPFTCIEALVADDRSTIATKKRSKKSILINSTVQNLYNQQNFAGTSMGPPPALTWKNMSLVDSLTDKLSQVDLNVESSITEEKYNAFFRKYYKEHYALVPYQNSGAVVPFDASFDQVRRRKPRAKVDLDDETTRVWKLLLENINSEGIDGTNEENTKWWEEERRVFIGRADSFIARMHLVQGDRRFSPWKGSVVDSVVGVFLTQNVSDHLSSSAFMSLAARFPARPSIHSAELRNDRSDGATSEPEVCALESEGNSVLTKEILNKTVCSDDTKTLQEFEESSIREANSVIPSLNAAGNDSSVQGNFRGQAANTSLAPLISCEKIIANRSVCLNKDGRDTEDTLFSQTPEISSQNSAVSPIAVQTTGKSDSCLFSTSEEEPATGVKPNWLTSPTSFIKLLEIADNVLQGNHGEGSEKRNADGRCYIPSESLSCSLQNEDYLDNYTVPAKTIASCNQMSLYHVPGLGAQSPGFDLYQKNSKFSDSSSEKELCTGEISELSSESASGTSRKSTTIDFGVPNLPSSIAHSSSNQQIEINQMKVDKQRVQALAQKKMQEGSEKNTHQNLMDATGSSTNIDSLKHSEHKKLNSNKNGLNSHPEQTINGPNSMGGRISKEKEIKVDWDQLRKHALFGERKSERTDCNLDSVDWDAIRCADVNEIAHTIKERGMNNVLAERIKDFLNRLVRDHGSIDLEWLRDVPPDKAKEYLLSIRGLGLKSVECVRLLTLHHLAFPVDTNVGRIAVRLGWVPLRPLPESLQLHLLELYPILESIQKYLWPRLCKLDQKTLYELHYQMITFGKVFCTKSRPNCNACPMRGECRHFASAYASARLALPAPQDKSIVCTAENKKADQNPVRSMDTLQLSSPQTEEMDHKTRVTNLQLISPQTEETDPRSRVSNSLPIIEEPQTPDPIIEVPTTPEPDDMQDPECDIESAFGEDPDEIPTIQLNMEEFTHNLQTIMQQNTELQEGEKSKALVALTSEAASIPVPKLKNVSRLRTEHQVYELPDLHPLLEGMDKREPDDPCPYLLAIWTPGETMDSIEQPGRRCSSQEPEKLCTDETCASCNCIREAKSQTVRGTLLIPCRTAMQGSFPLNGTYFQVNEVFSDHESSLSPMDIPRKWLWNLPRRTVYFGTSIPTIFKGLSTEGIQYCFWRGFVCVRGFDRKTRAPRPLIARLHFPASKLAKGKGKTDES